MSNKNSPITLARWHQLEAKARIAQAALEDLHHEILMTATYVSSDVVEDKEMINILFAEAQRVERAKNDFHGPYYWHPQPEWTGGEGNVMREPHIMGFRRLPIRK